MPYNRHVTKAKDIRRYTFSHTKVMIGFLLSVVVSIFLGTYFERYGTKMIKSLIAAVNAKPAVHMAEPVDEPEEILPPENVTIDEIQRRIDKL